MNKGSKIAVTVIIVFAFFIIGIFLQEAGISKTFVALLALGLFYGIRSMWQKPKEVENSSNKIKLNKDKSEDDDNQISLKK